MTRLSPCPGAILQRLQPIQSAIKPFYSVKLSFPTDLEACEESLRKVMELDADDNVLVVMAHDPVLKGLVNFFPEKVNNWRSKDVKSKVTWLFLRDFRTAIEQLAC